MAFNTKNLLTSADGHFIPQMYDAVNDTYVPLVQKEYYGKSTDTKPTTNVPTGASFLEMDTKNVFMLTELLGFSFKEGYHGFNKLCVK